MKSLTNPQEVAEIRGRILALTAADSPRWGVMNVVEMMCHVREAFLYTLSSEPPTYHPGKVPPKLMKRLALRLPVRWPQNVETVPALKVGGSHMNPLAFAVDHETLVVAYDRFCAAPEITKDHPIFTTMTHADWMRWGYLHTDHHLRQFGR